MKRVGNSLKLSADAPMPLSYSMRSKKPTTMFSTSSYRFLMKGGLQIAKGAV
jgi:hypothetical protein